MSTDIHQRALRRVNSEILALDGCIERLSGIDNPALNREAHGHQVARLEKEREEWRYVAGVLENGATHEH